MEPNQNPPEPPQNGDPFKEVDVPKKGEVTISELQSRKQEKIKNYQEKNIDWGRSEIREELFAEANYEEPSLRGPIQIAKGQAPILALNFEQSKAVDGILFDMDSARHFPAYAKVQATGQENPQTIEAQVKIVFNLSPKTANHLIISEGLASALGTTENKDIKVVKFFQKVENIDLDKID